MKTGCQTDGNDSVRETNSFKNFETWININIDDFVYGESFDDICMNVEEQLNDQKAYRMLEDQKKDYIFADIIDEIKNYIDKMEVNNA